MSLLDKASLIVTPNAYEESKLYSVVPNTTLGDMDVVRATTATRVNSAGLIEVVPRNLLTYSEQFENANWTKANSISVTANTATAPNGTLTADTLLSTLNASIVRQTVNSNPASIYNFSVWLKRASGTPTTRLRIEDNSAPFNSTFVNVTPTNDWVRYEITRTTNAGVNSIVADIFPDFVNGTGSVYAWGAQLEQGATATEYFPTTTRLNIPRIDYTNGSCPSLLVEPQRTNVLTYSNEFSNAAWSKNTGAILANNATSPEGITNASKLVGVALTTQQWIYRLNAPVVSGSQYTFSMFAKKGEYNFIQLRNLNNIDANTVFNLNTGTVHITSTGTAKIENYGNGWYRCSVTATATVTGNSNIYVNLSTDGTGQQSFLGNGTSGVFIYGAQHETGSYSTSYISTVASTVTRNADVISKTGISSLIGQTEGTVFVDVNLNSRVTQTYFAISSGANATTDYIGISFRASTIVFEIVRASVLQASHSLSNSSTGRFKLGIGYKANDFVFYSNGIQLSTDNSGTVPTCNDIVLFNSAYSQNQALNYNSVQLYKTRLTNTELAQLTTL